MSSITTDDAVEFESYSHRRRERLALLAARNILPDVEPDRLKVTAQRFAELADCSLEAVEQALQDWSSLAASR